MTQLRLNGCSYTASAHKELLPDSPTLSTPGRQPEGTKDLLPVCSPATKVPSLCFGRPSPTLETQRDRFCLAGTALGSHCIVYVYRIETPTGRLGRVRSCST